MKTVKTLSLGLLALAMLGGAAGVNAAGPEPCLLYTSDAADEL